jgi:non-ribosomal peptide synthetase component F
VDVVQDGATFDLVLSVEENDSPSSMDISLRFNSDLYSRSFSQKLLEHYVNILSAVTHGVSTKIRDVHLMSSEEYRKIMLEFNDTRMETPPIRSLHDLVSETIARVNSTKVAVSSKSETITYAELNAQSQSLASVLMKSIPSTSESKGQTPRPQVVVATFMPRCVHLVVSALGILKSGGAYLFIDPNLPENRIAYMFEDSKVSFVITKEEWKARLPQTFQGVVLVLDSPLNSPLTASVPFGSMTHVVTLPADLAYVVCVCPRPALLLFFFIFISWQQYRSDDVKLLLFFLSRIDTSGTTGNPKGICIEHRNILNFSWWFIKTYGVSSNDVASQLVGQTFDPINAGKLFSVLSSFIHLSA